MKKLVILGAGTAGTMVANRMARSLPRDWQVEVVDPETFHVYQPGLLFLPFGAHDEDRMIRPRGSTLSRKVTWRKSAVEAIDTERKTVDLSDGESLAYDMLVIATGTRIRPDMTEGMLGDGWRKDVFDFYTLDGARALRDQLADWEGGRLVLNVVEMPIKCPVAPLELLFLADDFFRRRGIRDRVELVYATPLDAAFTKPLAAKHLGYLLEEKGISMETEYMTAEVDADGKRLVSYDEREVPYDLLVTIPTHSGAELIEKSGLGDELAFVPTDKHTLRAIGHDDVFVLGDATNLPVSKAGSVAHFQSEVLCDNLLRMARGEEPAEKFDGHANCFIETGNDRAMLIDFNYEVEPLPGTFPIPGLGPFRLLKETRMNHRGKLLFRWLYWNGLLPARPIPVSPHMSMAGKQPEALPALPA